MKPIKRKLLFFLTMVLISSINSEMNAQFWKKIKKKAEEVVSKKADEKIDDVLTKKEKKKTDSDSETNKNDKPSGEKNKKVDNQSGNKNTAELYRNFKYIPGEKVIFSDDLEFEEVGEFPSKWDLLRGGVEVATLGKDKVIYGTSDDYNRITPLFNSENYLSDEFTIEFDIYVNSYPKYGPETQYDISFRKESFYVGICDVQINIGKKGVTGLVKDNKRDFNFETVPSGEENDWHRISLSYYKKKMKIYYDGQRISNLPNFKLPIEKFAIQMYTHDKNHKVAIKNIRIAYGGGQMYKRILSKGKYSTNGILFDSGKATIKPQSMGVINKIASIMKEKSDWKFEIIGHTDSDGDEKSNLELSIKRAQSVKEAIIEKGISKDRLTVSGKGETEPLNKNSNELEKTNNRRVEFIKK
ncbi:OmpA family protein [Tenacibaculum sp. MEBiC06402]|uniref:OmpA family protein n=1 Tax=unclassified Tenacibaculum TaxID=2635139 RepID=UPI003B997AC5